MEIANIKSNKKWLLGIKKSKSPIEIGYFEKAEDPLHYHKKIFEYYLVFSGTLILTIGKKRIRLTTPPY